MFRKALLVASASIALAFSPSVLLAAPEAAGKDGKTAADTYQLLSLFGDVFEKTRTEYVEPVSDEELIENALNGMLSALDPHSGYLNAKSFKDMQVQTKGEFGGLGIEVTMENGWVKVVSPIDDTPAARAGLRPNDWITHLDGESVQGLSLNDAVDRMRGAVGAKIRITVTREGQAPFDVTLTRAVIKIQTVRSKLLNDVAYIRISQFVESTDSNLRAAIEKMKKESKGKLKGYILDLRNNPGGLLEQAIAVAGDFIEKGEIVSTRSRDPQNTQRFNAHGSDLTGGLPIVVLINDGSASASEIVAGALQDHRRAILMGTKSFGKGSVQTIIRLSGYGAMRLTTARYYTPSGRSIQAVGIEPDIIVEPVKIASLNGVATQLQPRSEASLRGALRNDTLPEEKTDQGDKKEDGENQDALPQQEAQVTPSSKIADPENDYQLSRAIDLLRGLSLYRDTGRK